MTAELKLSIALFSSQIGLARLIELYCQGDKCVKQSVFPSIKTLKSETNEQTAKNKRNEIDGEE